MSLQEQYRMILQTDYCAYVHYVHKGAWKISKFHRFMCDMVQDFVEKDTGNAFDILILSVPPQHGKSTTITETLPSWYLGRHPMHRVIEISYSEEFAKKFGRRNRSKIKDYGGEVFGIQMAASPDTNTEFELNNGYGGMISRGLYSGVTGNPANLMIIDDPVKTQEDADSESQREGVWEEWLASYRSRLAPGAKVIVIMTRWHEDDLAGRLIDNEADVTVINLPLEAEDNDPLGRNIGDALCPEIGKDNKWLESFKKVYTSEKGSRAWNALYQGHPTGLEGNLIKREWWKYYDKLPEIAEWVMSVDAAFKDGEDNDFVAIQVWGKTGADIYLIDAVKKHLNLPDTMREITRLRSLYPMCKTTLIEDKANGSAIINIMRKMMTGIIAVEPKGGKMSRVNAIIGTIESGNVYLPKNKPFTGDFVESCAAFPNGKHDDDVDAMSQGLNRLVYNSASLKKAKKADPIAEMFPNYNKKGKKKIGRGEKIRVV